MIDIVVYLSDRFKVQKSTVVFVKMYGSESELVDRRSVSQ